MGDSVLMVDKGVLDNVVSMNMSERSCLTLMIFKCTLQHNTSKITSMARTLSPEFSSH